LMPIVISHMEVTGDSMSTYASAPWGWLNKTK